MVSARAQERTSTILRRFHLIAVAVWTVLLVPTLLVWKDSVLWIALMSVWANIMGHFASYMGARAERREIENGK